MTAFDLRRNGLAAVVLALLATGYAMAQSTIAEGTSVAVHLTSADIRTNKNQPGDTFSARVTAPYASRALRGAVVYGHVASIRSAGQGRTAQLALHLDKIVYADGETASVSAYSTSIAETKDNTTTRKALGAGVGAAVGSQTVGRILGGTLGKVVGIAGGAAGGYAYANNNRPNADVATGARMVFVTSRPIAVPRRQARS